MAFETSLNLATLLLAGGMSAMLAGVLRWYATPHQQQHYRHWTSAWLAQAAYYLIGGLTFFLAVSGTGSSQLRLGLSIATQVANTFASVLLLIGVFGFVRRKPVDTRALQLALGASLVIGTFVAILATGAAEGSLIRQCYRSFITAASFLGSAWIVWRHRAASDRPARLLGLALFAFGIAHLHYLVYWTLSTLDRRPTYPLVWFTLVDLLWLAGVAIATGALAVEDQREAAAAALHQQERTFRQMIEHASDITTVLDAQHAIRYVSPSAGRLLGWTDEVVGRSMLDFVHPDDQPTLLARVRTADPIASPCTLRVRTQRGNWLRLEAVASHWRNEQGDDIVIMNARDVSERERLEASLREAQKLESLGRLAGGVAHDLNNILMVIGGEAQLAADDATPQVRASLQEITSATDRAAALTRQLLTFARRQRVQPRVVNVSDVVDGVVRMAGRLVPASIELEQVAPTVPLPVLIDPAQLEQVVMNLVVNARDAIHGAGRITVELGERTLPERVAPDLPAGRYVAITVRDTGTGIPDEARAYVFEPFYTTKAQGEGTGLGLATSYGIVTQAGGSIRFESALAGGTTFEVLLPLTTDAPAATVETLSALPRVTGARVLLVEDDVNVRTVAMRALLAAGFEVREAADGVEALDLFAAVGGVRVLVTDVIMPRLGGRELARQLRERDPGLAILFLSGYPGDPEFERTMPSGARFLQKPVSPHELARAVQELADMSAR